jgi:uncharacterized NAD(P)/FAD-binding protein YdhS
MKFDLIFIGGGVGSSYGAINLIKKLNQANNKQQINIAIIDKNIKNIPGGVPYSKNLSSNGFFNNPCRLSPKEFISWTLKKKNKLILVKFLQKQKNYSIKSWLINNKEKFLKSKNLHQIKEIYFPRIFLNFWLEDIFINILKIKKKKIKVYFFEGEASNVIQDNENFQVIFKETLRNYKLINKGFKFKRKRSTLKKKIYTKKLFISLGLPGPHNPFAKNINDKFFMYDLYEQGGIEKLKKLILLKLKKKDKITIHFLGAKAGFLECLPELKNLIINKKKAINIIATSQKAETLNPASFSKNAGKYKLVYLNNKNLKKIKNGKVLFRSIIKEFNYAKKNNFYIYDAWTKILKKGIMADVLRNFSLKDLREYNKFYHNKIRNITRFTYPFTVDSKNELQKLGKIKMIKGKIKKLIKKSGIFLTKTLVTHGKVNKEITTKSDIIISVTGPNKFENLLEKNSLYNSMNICGKNCVNKFGFIINKKFQMEYNSNIYVVSFNASGYNNKRETIVKAVINNSNIASNDLSKGLIT